MEDLTVIYLTANRVPEAWQEYQLETLHNATGKAKIIFVSKKPMYGELNILQNAPVGTSNIYYQLYRGVQEVKTPYMAVAEDDTLYTKEHFEFRGDGFAYNANRWCLYTWGEPVYHLKNYIRTNAVMTCPTELALEALKERFDKYPHDMKDIPIEMSGELGCYEKQLGVTPRKRIDFKSDTPVVQFDHDYWTSGLTKSTKHHHKKNYGCIKAYDIPVWGKASELVKKFK